MNFRVFKKYWKMMETSKKQILKAKTKVAREKICRERFNKIVRKKDDEVLNGSMDIETGNTIMRMLLEFSKWCYVELQNC